MKRILQEIKSDWKEMVAAVAAGALLWGEFIAYAVANG